MIWDGREVLAWVRVSGVTQQFYSRGATLVKAKPTTGERFYHEDALGTILAVTTSAQSIQTNYALDAWGEVLTGSLANNPYVFVGGLGYWYDETPALYYVRARWLDPR